MDENKISDEDIELVAQTIWDEARKGFAHINDLPERPTSPCYSDAKAVLERPAGRLLPPGGEEQYRIVWSGQEGTYVDGEIDDLQDGLDHLAIIRGLSFVKEAHLERRILTDWSPVVSDNSSSEGEGS